MLCPDGKEVRIKPQTTRKNNFKLVTVSKAKSKNCPAECLVLLGKKLMYLMLTQMN